MAVKRILFPLFVIAVAFLVLNYIRPSVLSVLDQRAAKEARLAELAAVEETAANIGALSDSREALLDSDDGRAVMAYLPVKSDHDRIVDVLNYLALGSGANINEVSFEAGVTAPIAAPIKEALETNGIVMWAAPSVPAPSSFSVTADVSGAYGSLKSFLEKVTSVDRLKKVVSFSISEQDQSVAPGTDGQVPPDDGTLTAKIEIEFMYLPEASYPGAHLLPIFTAGNFDMESARQAMRSDGSIPTLPEPALPGRRPDPFKF